MTHQQSYFVVSGVILWLVALFHALRLVFRWPVSLRSQEIPDCLSGVGLAAAAVMCPWAFRLLV